MTDELSEPEFNEAVIDRIHDEGYGDVADHDAVSSGRMSPSTVARTEEMAMTTQNTSHVAWAILYWAYRNEMLDNVPPLLEAE